MPWNKGVNRINVRRQNTAATMFANWVRAPAAIATDVFERLPTTRKPPKRPLKMFAGPVGEGLLFRIDIAIFLRRSRLCPTERLDIAHQHDRKGTGRELQQDR